MDRAFAKFRGKLETRTPLVKEELKADVTVQGIRVENGRDTGLCVYVDFTINASDKPQTFKEGGYFSHRISGFDSKDALPFAMEDLALLLCEIHADGQPHLQGQPGPKITDEIDWYDLFQQTLSAPEIYQNRRLFLQVEMSKPGKKSGQAKAKARWFQPG
jgi:hypothetical protein